MAKKLPDDEHREYYEDRFLKAVYTIKDGKKKVPIHCTKKILTE